MRTTGRSTEDRIYIDLLKSALEAALRAGEAILEVYEGEFEVERKADDSPLTLADRRAHDLISSALQRKDSGIRFLSEEGRDIPYTERAGWQAFWLIDPLDGTKEFIKRNGEFTVNIALIERGRPVLGVIHVPVKGVVYFSLPDRGAFRGDVRAVREFISSGNGPEHFQKLRVTKGRERIVIAGSRSHGNERQNRFISRMKEICREVEFLPAGSSLKFCMIAEGRADVYPRYGPTMEWDTAAGQAIVEAAGGRVLEMETGRPLQYNKEDLHNPWFIAFSGEGKDYLDNIG